MNSRHTPGPWTVAQKQGLLAVFSSVKTKENPHGQLIAQIKQGPGQNAGENAVIIAAAPDMFSALKTLVADGECYCADNVANKEPCGHCRAVAAIDKAEGETNGP